MSYLNVSIIIVLDFKVYSLQNASGLCISSVPSDETHLQQWVRWQTYPLNFQIVCSTTARQCSYFRLWTSFMLLFWPLGIWNGLKVFGGFVVHCHCVHLIYPFWRNWKHAVFYGICWL